MISKFRARITFKSKTGVSDGAGGFVNTLHDYYTCWAEVQNKTNDKTNILSNDSINDAITFRIRWTSSYAFDQKLVISYKNNLYLINSIINEDNAYKYYLIGCSTVQ